LYRFSVKLGKRLKIGKILICPLATSHRNLDLSCVVGPGTTYALKFLALGITPFDFNHADCGEMFNRYYSIPILFFSLRACFPV